jgi:Ca2+-binding EF-hand superfamily protein
MEFAMLMALGAISSAVDALQSLTSSSSSQSSSSAQTSSSPFGLDNTVASIAPPNTFGSNGVAQISPQTMSALIAAQGQLGSSTTSSSSASLDPSQALQDLFSQIDANGDGQISKSEFENALGAGGTNLAQADDVFNKLDTNGDGSVSLSELKSALQGAGGHHGGGHHHHVASSGDSDGTNATDGSSSGTNTSGSSTDPLLQALAGASSTSTTNSDGSTTTSVTYADGSKVTLTTPAESASTSTSSSRSATSSYNFVEQMIQREAQALSASVATSLSVSA